MILTKKRIYYILIAVALILATLPWFSQGIAYTDDFRAHVAHFWDMKNSINEKGYVVSWMQELYSGWPIFQFYSLVPYYVSLPLIMLFESVAAIKLSVILSFIVAAICMFAASKMLFKDDDIAFVSTIAYTFFGYHFINAGSRGAFSELWGYSFFPLAIAFFIEAIENPSRKNTIYATLLTSLIVLTHVPVAYMLGVVYAAYLLYHVFTTKKITKTILKTIAFIVIASILLTSFWLVPFLTESSKVNFGDFYTENGPALIGLNVENGMSFQQLFSRNFENYGRLANGERIFYLGYALLALLALSFLYKNKLSRFFTYMTLMVIAALMIPFIMHIIPLASLLQFSFRLILIIAVAMAFVAGVSAKALSEAIKTKSKLLVIIAIAVLIIIDFAPANNFPWAKQPTENFINDPAQIEVLRTISTEPGYFMVFSPLAQDAFMYHKKFEMGFDWEGFRQGVVGAIYNNYTTDASLFIDGLKTGNLNKTVFISKRLGDYGVKYFVLPCINGLNETFAVKYTNNVFCAYSNPYFTQLVTNTNGQIRDIMFDINKITFASASDLNSNVTVKVSNFDHWHALVDGKEVAIKDAYPKFMSIEVPKGTHDVEIKYKNTNLQIITKVVSILSLLALFAYYFGFGKK